MAYQPLKVDVSGNALVVDADTANTASLAALNANLTIALNGDSNYALEVQGTFVGTLQMERTIDGVTWRPINGAIPGPLTIVQTLTAPGALVGYCGASASLRVNMIAYTSGTATVTLRVGSGVGAVFQIAPTQAGTNIIGKVGIDQTTPGITNAVAITTLPALPTGGNVIGLTNPDTTVAAVGLAALNAALQINLNGHGTVVMNVSGTFSATVTFQGLLPDGTWTGIYGYNGLDGGRIPALFSGAASLRFVASGLRAIRAILTAYTSGTATVSLEASYAQTPAPAPAVVIEGNAFADGTTSTQILGRTAGVGAASISKVPILDATGAWVMGTGNAVIGQTKAYRGPTSTVARVTALATTATILASNVNRSGASFYNESTAILYLKLGAAASLTSYSIQIAGGGYYELPFSYAGIIDGFWATAVGACQVTEVS